MELLKSLNFQDRYSDMEGAEGGYSGKERRKLKKAEKAGVKLSSSQDDRQDYLETINDERIGAVTNLGAAAVGTAVGAYTGNPALISSSLSMGADYLGGEMEETASGEGVSGKLQVEDAVKLASPFLTTMGQGTKGQGGGTGDGTMTGHVASDEGPLAGGGTIGGATYRERGGGGSGSGMGSVFDVNSLISSLAPPVQNKQGSRLRYNPRKYDYIKGNSFGF